MHNLDQYVRIVQETGKNSFYSNLCITRCRCGRCVRCGVSSDRSSCSNFMWAYNHISLIDSFAVVHKSN